MLRIPVLTAGALLAVGCAHLDYVGETYAPTTRADLYFAEADVPRPYQVIGKMVATGDQFTSGSRLHARIMEHARHSGADGVIVLGISYVPLHEETRVTGTTNESMPDSTRREVRSTSSVEEVRIEGLEIRALFIRYKE